MFSECTLTMYSLYKKTFYITFLWFKIPIEKKNEGDTHPSVLPTWNRFQQSLSSVIIWKDQYQRSCIWQCFPPPAHNCSIIKSCWLTLETKWLTWAFAKQLKSRKCSTNESLPSVRFKQTIILGLSLKFSSHGLQFYANSHVTWSHAKLI